MPVVNIAKTAANQAMAEVTALNVAAHIAVVVQIIAVPLMPVVIIAETVVHPVIPEATVRVAIIHVVSLVCQQGMTQMLDTIHIFLPVLVDNWHVTTRTVELTK